MKLESLAAFVGGVLVGGAVALLLAPKSGKELRGDIKHKLNDAKKHIDESFKACTSSQKESVEDIISFEE